MSEERMFGEADDVEVLARALGSGSPLAACMARGCASGWPQMLADWFNAEMARARSRPEVLVHALSLLQAQTMGSILAQITAPDSEGAVVDIYVDVVRSEMPDHMRTVRATMETDR